MKPCYMILSAAIPLLSGCAAYQKTADSDALKIQPVYSIRNSTETADGFYQLGRYYQGQHRLELALTAYQKSLSIDVNFAEAHNGLGVIYAMQGKQQQALEQFRQAVKLAPNAAHIRNNLGYALYLSKSYGEAASTLERAVALNPANQVAHTNLALALDKAGNREQAVQVMAQVTQPQPVVSPVAQVSQQAKTSVAAPATAAIPSAMPQLALPKNWGVITQAAPKPVPQAAIMQNKPNVYALREQTEVQVIAKPFQQTSVQPENKSVVAAAQKPVPAAEYRIRMDKPALSVARHYRIEVSNGNGVTGMAKKVAGFLGVAGYSGAHLTNQKPFHVALSQVQYRAGYREQAQSLALTLPRRPGIAQTDNLRANISIRVVLGKDLTGKVAYFEPGHDKLRLARY